MSAKPSGNAPKPTRMFVTAAGEPSEILKAAAVATGLVRYFTAISEKMIVAANSTNRLSHGTTRHLMSTVVLSCRFGPTPLPA